MTRPCPADKGFTIVELMVVMLIIGILVAAAIPMFLSTREVAAKKTCYANQRLLEGGTETWVSTHGTRDMDELIGPVTRLHPLVVEMIIGRVPRCPLAHAAADPEMPTIAEGAYVFLAGGNLEPCDFGDLGPHGHYSGD